MIDAIAGLSLLPICLVIAWRTGGVQWRTVAGTKANLGVMRKRKDGTWGPRK